MNLEKLYQMARKLYDSDPDFKREVHECTLRLQRKEPREMAIFRFLRAISTVDLLAMYKRLGVNMPLSAFRGESFYAGVPPVTVAEVKFAKQIMGNDGVLEDFDRDV